MKFANKEIKDYWKIIKIPTLILIAYNVLALIIGFISFELYTSIFSPIPGLVLTIAAFGFIGWHAVKDFKETVKVAAWAGAVSGVISGFVGAIIGIIMFYLVPDIILMAASQAGADPSQIQGLLAIGIYIGLVTGPLFSGIIGAIISSITGLIAKKV